MEKVVSYTELKNQHDKAMKDAKEALSALSHVRNSFREFYNNMRWEPNSCTEAEYSSLFPLVYAMEEVAIFDRVADTLESIQYLTSDKA